MSSTAEAPAQKKRLPGWILIPGGPSEPNTAEFRAKMARLAEEKRTLIAEVKELRASLGPREGREETEKEVDTLKHRMGDIDTERKAQQEVRFKINEEIQKNQKKHDECVRKLRELSDELGGFKSIKEIDEAIAYVTRKMETSGGGLAAEKRVLQRLGKLEEAKRYLLELQPLNEAVNEAKHREAMLQREWQEINERIRDLRSEYNEQRSTKQQKEQEMRNTGVNRSEIYKKCDEINSKINKLNEEMNALREAHHKSMEAWNAWREEARAKYAAKIEAERKERHRRYLERINATKIAEKRARALRRQNPYEVEIDACRTLSLYLRDLKTMVQREEAELARQQAAATFDPAKFVPAGAVFLNDGKKWGGPQRKGAAGGKQKNKTQAPKQTSGGTPKNHVIQHSEEKMRLFQLIGEEPPLALAAIDDTVEKIRVKQKEYESHIKTGELEISSDDEEEEENKEEEEKNGENKEEDEEEVQHTEDNAANKDESHNENEAVNVDA